MCSLHSCLQARCCQMCCLWCQAWCCPCVAGSVVAKKLFAGSVNNAVFKLQDGGSIGKEGFHFGTDTTKSIGSTTEQWDESTSTCHSTSFGFHYSTDTANAKTSSKLSPSPAAAWVSSLQKEPALESTKQAPTGGVKQAPAPTEGVKQALAPTKGINRLWLQPKVLNRLRLPPKASNRLRLPPKASRCQE